MGVCVRNVGTVGAGALRTHPLCAAVALAPPPPCPGPCELSKLKGGEEGPCRTGSSVRCGIARPRNAPDPRRKNETPPTPRRLSMPSSYSWRLLWLRDNAVPSPPPHWTPAHVSFWHKWHKTQPEGGRAFSSVTPEITDIAVRR